MGYFLVFSIILTFSITLSILLKKRIEQVIPISVVGIIIIIYLAGLLNNLKAGVYIVQILTALQLVFILVTAIKKDKQGTIKELINNIATPGLLVYVLLYIGAIFINRDRIFEDYDEFNHWAVIIKNMFMYNTYGTNPETIVRFNEYPPFTAVFQYLFIVIKNVFREDTIIIAQNMLYFSIIIPITKNIRWNKSLKKLITLVPLIIFIPMIFYKNFYLDILVDALLGIMFAYVIFAAFEKEDNFKFKFLKILAGEIMLCLTKTSGMGLAVLAIAIIIIKILIDKKQSKESFNKQIIATIIVILITSILTSIWYIKVNNAEKRWDFTQYVETETDKTQEKMEVAEKFIKAIFLNQEITDKELTVFNAIIIFICIHIFQVPKNKENNYKYYSLAMLVSIPIYLIILLISYATIFELIEAHNLTCFGRYASTILLAYASFQMMVVANQNKEEHKGVILLVVAVILALAPTENIAEKYIYGKNYITTSNINRDIYTKIKNYTKYLEPTDKILFVVGPKADLEYLTSLNKYEIMPIRIEETTIGNFGTQENFENIAKKYTHIFIYRMKVEEKENIKSVFENENVQNDTLYKVNTKEGKIVLETVR